jgi:hypothetical protein
MDGSDGIAASVDRDDDDRKIEMTTTVATVETNFA